MDNKEAIHKLIQFRRILEKGVFPVGYKFDAEPFEIAIVINGYRRRLGLENEDEREETDG